MAVAQSESESRAGLRCFNNPPGDYFSLSDYRGHWIQGCEGRLVGCRQCHPARTPTFATTDKSPRCSNWEKSRSKVARCGPILNRHKWNLETWRNGRSASALLSRTKVHPTPDVFRSNSNEILSLDSLVGGFFFLTSKKMELRPRERTILAAIVLRNGRRPPPHPAQVFRSGKPRVAYRGFLVWVGPD